jgi:hypothetical protein
VREKGGREPLRREGRKRVSLCYGGYREGTDREKSGIWDYFSHLSFSSLFSSLVLSGLSSLLTWDRRRRRHPYP